MLPPGLAPGETAWICTKCGFGFPDHTRADCEAPVYLTKQQKVVAEVSRTLQAVSNGDPLTAKEQTIAHVLPKSLVDNTTPSPYSNVFTPDEERKIRIEWSLLKIQQKTSMSVDEYLREKERIKCSSSTTIP